METGARVLELSQDGFVGDVDLLPPTLAQFWRALSKASNDDEHPIVLSVLYLLGLLHSLTMSFTKGVLNIAKSTPRSRSLAHLGFLF